jgi:hypothetical protein
MKEKARSTIPLLAPGTPRTVQIAVLLFTLSWLDQIRFLFPLLSYIFRQGLYASQIQRLGSVFIIVILGCWLALNAALIIGLIYQKNWARITQMLLTLFGLLLLALAVAFSTTFKAGNLYIVSATAAVLLFLPSASAWFNPHKQQAVVPTAGSNTKQDGR